jgi:hypothetical protein
MSAEHGPSRPAAGLLVALYAVEGAAAALGMACYKFSDRLGSLTASEWTWIVAPAATLVAAGVFVARQAFQSRRSGHPWFALTLALNLVPVTILVAAGEATARLLAVSTPLGLSVAGTLLLPRNWDQVRARNAELLRHAPSNLSYFVHDSLLGWTVGRSRSSTDGLYQSSAEGIRSGREGVRYADRQARYRIATVGDSYTFGLEVPFESSWGYGLEQALGPGLQVLNFGADGYGIDQAYLRYQRDVRPWHPALVIFGFIEHDLYRALSVYTFVTFPEWGFPFSKPRFVDTNGEPRLVNVPLIGPAQIMATPSIAQLPFIDDDPGYSAAQWQWHLYDASYLLRYVLSRFPKWTLPSRAKAIDLEQDRLGTDLLLGFVRQATAQGSVPLLVYFPSRGDFEGQDRSAKQRVLAALRRAGVHPLDLTTCVGALGEARAFIPGRPHYSAAGNAAVARCLAPVVRRLMHG